MYESKTNEELYHDFMVAALTGFCANGNWNGSIDPCEERVGLASKVATLALADHRKRWPGINIKKAPVSEIGGNDGTI